MKTLRSLLAPTALAASALFCVLPAHADIFTAPKPYEGSWLDLTLASKHVNTQTPHNEKNFGIGVERWAFGRNWLAGSYKNSYYRNSSFVLTELTSVEVSDTLRLRINGGIVTGYNKSILPGFVPIWTYQRKRWGVDVLIIPPVGSSTGIFAVQAKVKL